MEKRTTSTSLYAIVDGVDMPNETRSLIEKYLSSNGVYRERIKESIT